MMNVIRERAEKMRTDKRGKEKVKKIEGQSTVSEEEGENRDSPESTIKR